MGQVFKWGGIAILVILGLTVVSSFLRTTQTVVTAPGRVIERTMETDNIISNYEWYHDTNAAYEARYNQVQQFKLFLSNEEAPKERSRLRMEMAAIQQTCRDLVTKYNANSEKINRNLFKGWSLPEALDINTCE